MFKRILLTLLLALGSVTAYADQHTAQCAAPLGADEQRQKFWRVNMWGTGITTLWGTLNWGYFQSSPHAQNEEWFSNGTGSGGADKLGHFYSGYVTTKGLAYYFEKQCFPKPAAARYAALSTFLLAGVIEAGDAFSKHGFSTNDFLIGSLGSMVGYAMLRYPELDKKVDLRVEYGFSPASADVSTDYNNQKFLVALKLNGFKATRRPLLRHLELQVGYYTRGFGDDNPKERNLYVGVGLNLSDMLRSRGYRKTGTLLNYLQLPGTYVAAERDLNQ